jgi:Ni,Fe-hydrogenase III large subunit
MTDFADLPFFPPSGAISLYAVPVLEFETFATIIVGQVAEARKLVALFGREASPQSLRLTAVLADHTTGLLAALSCDVGDRFPSLTHECPQAHWFEREIAEQWGVVVDDHPWFKPIRYHASYRPGHDAWGRAVGDRILPCVTDYFQVRGSEVHEVAVGPIHAGVIEPGSFRFQCHGETVFHLEIALGYQHRGVERQFVGGPNKRTIHYMETLAGDTSIGHATAYCQTIEALAGGAAPLRAQAVRAVALELERLANHTGDLGALADDVGFLPTASFCGRIRGDFLNATAHVCGNRFGRGVVRPGGVGYDINGDRPKELIDRLGSALRDVGGAANLLLNSMSVQARFEDTGAVSRETCLALGMVGPAARACGVDRDVRHDFPTGYWRFAQVPVSSWKTGDVFARAYVRHLEIQRSGTFLLEQLAMLPDGPTKIDPPALRPETLAVSLVEGWRGAICHVATTDRAGQFAHYKIVDPSFHNWIGLAMALRDQQISDFPVCNKSFNLSYCGHDL